MPEYRRIRIEGGVYFFTVVTYHRKPIFNEPRARKILHDAWKDVQARFPFETIAVVLLPDHLHCIWKLPTGDANYSVRWKEIKRLFSKEYKQIIGPGEERNTSRQKREEAAIWQRRFWEHTICDEIDLENHVDYIHYNPIKHEYVTKAADWQWTSFHRLVGEGIYDNEWMGGEIGRLEALNYEKWDL